MGCFDSYICQCSGWTVDRHDPPLVYDVTRDPGESSPLDTSDPTVADIVRRVEVAVSKHRDTIPDSSASQFSVMQVFPRPWNQPLCAAFPFYSCTDPYLEQLKAMKKEARTY